MTPPATPDSNVPMKDGPVITPQPSDKIPRARALILESLCPESEEPVELEHLVQAVEGLLVTNEDIKRRCRTAKGKGFRDDDWIVKRDCFQYVRVAPSGRPSRHAFSAWAEHQEIRFGSPPPFPTELSDIVVMKTGGPNGTWPDYRHFFERSLLLHESILVPFLTNLKGHLEAVQDFSGKWSLGC